MVAAERKEEKGMLNYKLPIVKSQARRGWKLSCFVCFVLLLSAPVPGQLLQVEVQEHTLPNGLTILLYPDHHSPSVACRLFYKTGSVNEYPGVTGASHMFEHMMFKGTRRIGVKDSGADSLLMVRIDEAFTDHDSLQASSADTLAVQAALARYKELLAEQKAGLVKEELWNSYLENGGTQLNAFTTDILTAYFVTLPKNKIELFFWLESDRMQNAVLREFYSERDVVAEERRLRYENRPTGRYWETLDAMFYEAHPYRNPTIGWMSDITHFSKPVLRDRFELYYQPGNTVLVLAGDFEVENVLELAEGYFGRIPRGERTPLPVTVREPEQIGEKRLRVRREATPRVDLLFHTPGLGDADLYGLDLIEGALSGRNGRLYRRLVKELELCTDAGAGNGVQRYTGYFHVHAVLKKEADHQKVEAILLEELEKLKTDSLSDYELQRVKNNVAVHTVNSLLRVEEVANRLGFWEAMGGWEYINRFPQGVQDAGKDDVLRVAKEYFVEKNRTVAYMVSEEDGE